MSMIDYGAILKKNGKIVNRGEFFMDMKKAVGWTDNPPVRYADCDCLDGLGNSMCCACSRMVFEKRDDGYIHPIADCHGNEPFPTDKIGDNWFAYAGDTELVVGFYKQMVMTWYNGEKKVHWLRWDYADKYSINIEVGGTKLHFKALSENKSVYYGRFYYKGDLYEVVFGYGIDSTQSTWNRVKKDYCDKKTIKFVDKFWEEK